MFAFTKPVNDFKELIIRNVNECKISQNLYRRTSFCHLSVNSIIIYVHI